MSNTYDTAFLPAALEIVETPPSPLGRAIGAAIIAFFCIALGWAIWGTVDIVATAQGKIVPGGRTKLIQPFEIGVVRAIHVRDGQPVKAGDVLIELNPTMSAAELGHIRSDLIAAQLEIARTRAALSDKEDPALDFVSPSGAPSDLVEMQKQYLTSQTTEYRAKVAEVDRQIAQKEAERDSISAALEKIAAILPPLQERVDIRKYLYGKELGSKLLYLTEYQDLVGQQQEMEVQRNKRREAVAAVATLKETRRKAIAEYHRIQLDDRAKAEQKAAALEQDLIRAGEKTRLQMLTAPIDGTVQQLAVHTIGGVVTPAQALAIVVPQGAELEIEAMISNRDIGFVHAGQEVAIKIDTFPFTRYGLLHGKVLSVSQDAITREKPQDRNNPQSRNPDEPSSEPPGQELVYSARVSLDQTTMQVDDKAVDLNPGMAATVEIKTGLRRIISYILSPLVRYQHDVLRER
jgi:membrane fusion protein, hemolysin D